MFSAFKHTFDFVACSFDCLSEQFLVKHVIALDLREACFVRGFHIFYLEIVADGVVYMRFAHLAHHSVNFKDGRMNRR